MFFSAIYGISYYILVNYTLSMSIVTLKSNQEVNICVLYVPRVQGG